MNDTQKYEFADWMIHEVIPERLEMLNGEMIEGSHTHTVIAAQIVALRALPTIDSADRWTAVRPDIVRALSTLSALSALSDLSALGDLGDLRDLSDLSDLRALSALGDLRDLSDLSDLRALSALSARFEALYRRHIAIAIERGFVIVPVVPRIDAAILAAIETPGADGFDMGDWHHTNCRTTHCRGGWAIHLAGEAGYALERQFSAPTAGALIYIASRPDQPIPNFYATTEAALKDIRKCAAEQLAEEK